MKSFGILHVFPLFLLLLTCLWAGAQDYVITSKGDSVAGQVKPLLFGIDKKVQVTSDGKKKVVYSMFQVKEYRFKDEMYQPVKGPDGYAFMKRVKHGYLSLFAYQLPNQVTFDGTYLVRKDGTGMDVPNISFKKTMKNFLKDCPAVVDRIENGELAKKDLLTIIDQYNLCINQKTVQHDEIIAAKVEQTKVINVWDALEQKVKEQADFDGKSNALDMISEIKGKIARSEKIPNFLVEGLKSSLNQDMFKPELDNALKEIN